MQETLQSIIYIQINLNENIQDSKRVPIFYDPEAAVMVVVTVKTVPVL